MCLSEQEFGIWICGTQHLRRPSAFLAPEFGFRRAAVHSRGAGGGGDGWANLKGRAKGWEGFGRKGLDQNLLHLEADPLPCINSQCEWQAQAPVVGMVLASGTSWQHPLVRVRFDRSICGWMASERVEFASQGSYVHHGAPRDFGWGSDAGCGNPLSDCHPA